jgi:hypothetical protein
MDEQPNPNADKKFVILGTAPTWRLAPWDDPTAVMAGLNDAYLLGLPRMDLWYDLHPFNQFFYKGGAKLHAHQIPAGMFVRPKGHLEWLARQTCPVFIQQPDPRVPNAKVFPREALEARFGTWFDSSPAWMLVHAIAMGFKEIHIYGIHLASEMEYIKQKPNMTFLCGLAVGAGVKLVVPRESPLLQSTHRYAFEADPSVPVQQVQRDAQRLEAERQAVDQAYAASKSWRRPAGDPLLRDRRAWLKAKALDLQQAVQWETYKKRALTGSVM